MSGKVSENVWGFLKQRLGYTDEEFEKFRSDPRNEEVMRRTPDLLKKTIVFEVVSSRGCNIEHKVGDRFFFSGEGAMLAHKCPKKVCPYILPSMINLTFAVQERLYGGIDPQPVFGTAGCADVGVECGGWGRVIFETKVVDREEAVKMMK